MIRLCVLLFAPSVFSQFSVNKERLFNDIEELGKIGAYYDEVLGVYGVRKPGLSEADGEARRLAVNWFQQAQLDVRIDGIGNIFGYRGGMDNSLAPIMSGSHVDSVLTGGRFDGPLGVLGSLEVIRTMNEHNITTLRPIIIAIYSDEEGRFGNKPGSAVAMGKLDLETAYEYRDLDGLRLYDELDKIGFVGSEPVNTIRPHAHVELHIEQGPILRRENLDIGIVTGIPSIWRYEIDIKSVGGHAGATPIEYRSDSGLAAAHINVKLREMMSSGRYGPDMRVTMGIIETFDGSENVIPSHIRTSIDLRNPIDDEQTRVIEDIIQYAELTRDEDVEIIFEQRSGVPAALLHPEIMDVIEGVTQSRELSYRYISSGAGHDSANFAEIARSGMIFVPGENDGISHNPLEYSTPEQCEDGANVLLDSIIRLANEP